MNSICTTCHKKIDFSEFDKFIACPTCKTFYNVEFGTLKFYKNFEESVRKSEVCFEIGQKIEIHEDKFIIQGVVCRKDKLNISWLEYHLKNTKNELYFLNEYHGNWSLLKKIDDVSNNINFGNYESSYKNIYYKIFQKYYQRPIWAIGSFDIDLFEYAGKITKEYINPPEILVYEGKDSFHGIYVEEDLIYQQYLNYNNKSDFPLKIGIGATEPHKPILDISFTVQSSFWTLLLALITYFLLASNQTIVFEETYRIDSLKTDSTNNLLNTKPIFTKSFNINKKSKIEVEYNSDAENSWVESTITLVNETTGAEMPFVIGTEYYHGYESGESWSEGSHSEKKSFSSVASGKYHLIIETSAGYASGYFKLKLSSGGNYLFNLIALIILISIVPAFLLYLERNFEKDRWSDSDYSPYVEDDDNEDSIWS